MKKKIIIVLSVIFLIVLVLPSIYYVRKRSYMAESMEGREWTITSYAPIEGIQAMSYTIVDDNNNLIIIDGGYEADSETVKQIIHEHDNHVIAWIITHPHPDHVGAFNSIMSEKKNSDKDVENDDAEDDIDRDEVLESLQISRRDHAVAQIEAYQKSGQIGGIDGEGVVDDEAQGNDVPMFKPAGPVWIVSISICGFHSAPPVI